MADGLAKRVKGALQQQTRSAGVDVDVEERPGGVVRLHGIVDTLSQKLEAERIAQAIAGVAAVENDLSIGLEGQLDSRAIAETLQARLAAYEVGAEFVPTGGVARLYGTVSREVAEAAIRIAQGVPGVAEVIPQFKGPEGAPQADSLLSKQANSVLERLGYGRNRVQTYVADGVIHVKGLVESQAKKEALVLALRRLGARTKTTLVVEPEAKEQIR